MDEYLRNEHKFSILQEYKLDSKILQSVADQMSMHEYLPQMFEKIVQPMTKSLKQLMTQMLFVNESQLFSSDLRYKMCDKSMSNQYRGECPMKHEELLNQFEEKFELIKEKYVSRFDNLVK